MAKWSSMRQVFIASDLMGSNRAVFIWSRGVVVIQRVVKNDVPLYD